MLYSYGLKTNQINIYAGITAARVNGTPIFKKSEFFTSYPSLRKIPIAVILALAPIGVKLPPKVAPHNKPKYRSNGFARPNDKPILLTTGNIVATYGILSMKAENTTLNQTIIVYIKNKLPPLILLKSLAIASITPNSVIPPITINKPNNNNTV